MSPDAVQIACSLDAAGQRARGRDWSAIADLALDRHWDGDTLRLAFANDADVAADITRLAVLEQKCCPFFSFTVRVDAGTLTLDVTAPPEARELVSALLAG